MNIEYHGECESCNSYVKKLVEYKRPGEWNNDLGKFDTLPLYLCSFCAYTMVGRSKKDEIKKLFGNFESKALTMDELGKTVCYVGNEVLKAVNELRNELKGDK